MIIPVCEICSKNNKNNKNKPDKLTLMYNPEGQNSEYQGESYATCRRQKYPKSTTIVTQNKKKEMDIIQVTDGSIFELNGQFNDETVFNFGDGESCFITTSCSVPLVAGDQIGPFVVVAGNECTFGR
jgi:hypothetical protein